MTPEHPELDKELVKRLERFLVLHHVVSEATREHKANQDRADINADRFLHGWLLKGAVESIDDLGPLAGLKTLANEHKSKADIYLNE